MKGYAEHPLPPWRDPWVWGGAVVIALGILGGVWLVLWMLRPKGAPAVPMAVLTVVPAPSPTATLLMTPTPAAPTPTPIAPPPPPSNSIAVGALVQIRGTGGDGLRLRAKPSLKAVVLALAKEGEAFRVVDGPRSADGYTWWRLEAPHDAARGGWAVSNYLGVVPPTPTLAAPATP